ncbi:hypothetical protein PIROE2DRAFT_6374, partial [Piromyces sp. E2]
SLKTDKDNTLLLDIGLAVDYLNIPKLFNLVCRYIASDIRGTSTDYIREYFHIPPPEDAENAQDTQDSQDAQDGEKK